MKFVRYPSIENINRIETVDNVIKQGFSVGEWCATNKIHGANASYWCSDGEVRIARRSSLLGPDGSGLYCSKVVYNKYYDNIKEMSLYFKSQFDFDTMVAYGELFGGLYPHPDVPRVANASRVQKGVFYCPHNDFMMFDIAFYVGDTLLFFLSKVAVGFHGAMFGIPVIELTHRGTFDEMLSLDPVFEDPTYKLFNLPKIENNMSEGWVISPIDTHFFNSGSRVILKNKNPTFSEKSKGPKEKIPKEISPAAAKLLEPGLTYVTENRLRNVLSHGYDIGQKDFGKLLSLLVQDVFEAFSKDFGDELTLLEKKDKKTVNSGLNKTAANLIKLHFQNIVDGSY